MINYETHIKHHETLLNIVKHHEKLAIRCDDIGARCGNIGARADCGLRHTDSCKHKSLALQVFSR